MSQPRYAAPNTSANRIPKPPRLRKHPTSLMTAHITLRHGRSQPLVYEPPAKPRGRLLKVLRPFTQPRSHQPHTLHQTPSLEHGPQQNWRPHIHRRKPHKIRGPRRPPWWPPTPRYGPHTPHYRYLSTK
ncbi:hypothetical protein DEO72_LG5g1777 [Vigna unguiculata]|uniref:Uncharacterized protein n=1 Tax=Vigna unguiculata TaxID=3917 RepID=A0A4D6LZC2_VIGUN|nr:hypothetical protein DEO72_LG5g1777 [Vigna unguiculata]